VKPVEGVDRRAAERGSLLRTVVDLTFLALAVVLIVTLLANRYDSTIDNTTALEIQNLRKDFLEVNMKNVMYLESKINRVAESSDSYKVGMTQRMQVLENRIVLVDGKTREARVVNTNTNINK
jgi:hypothetical protein